jgi:hypothetical protein
MIPINNYKSHRIFALVLLAVTLLLGSGCTARLADLTLVSTKNIDLSNAQLDVTKGKRAKGEDCKLIFLFTWGLPNLEAAVDKALEKGNGNVMIDQVTYYKLFTIVLLPIGQACLEVEGTVLQTAEK